MFEAAIDAIPIVFTPTRIGFLLLGTMAGVVVGALPGLGGVVGMSILLPFVFGMETYSGIALMMGLIAVIHTSDTFPSVLIGTPGSSGAQATIMDGYPLAQKGEASRALGASFMSSLLGGLFGAAFLFTLLFVARPIVQNLTSPRLFMLGVLGVCTVGSLMRGSALTGVISTALGLFLGTVGGAIGAPTYRYTFDTIYLMDGLPIAIVALAMFGIPELIDLLAGGGAVSDRPPIKGGLMKGVREVFSHKMLVLRSSLVGTAVGFTPGIGASVVDWLSYGVAERTVKKPHHFGEGDIRGVIAPESANNAKEGGALVPTLLFGIPGSATNALLLGGLILLGIQTGPNMVGADLPITLSILWTLTIANVFGTLACMALVIPISKMTGIPGKRIVPFLFVLIAIAAYQTTAQYGDFLVLGGLAVLGWTMKRAGWPRAPLLIGAVLSKNLERYLSISIGRYEYTWLTDPLVLVLAALSLLIMFGGARGAAGASSTKKEAKNVESDA